MKSLPSLLIKSLTATSLLFFAITLVIQLLWIYAFNQGTTHIERVEIFQNCFPSFMQDLTTINNVGFRSSLLAIIFSSICLIQPRKLLKPLNFVILILSILLFSFYLFQKM